MEKTTRMWLGGGAILCAILAAIGWLIAAHAYTKTPQIHEVVLHASGVTTPQSKAVFLFLPPAFQTFLCWMLVYPNVRWTTYLNRVAAAVAPKDVWTAKMGGRFTFPTFCRIASVGLCVVSGINLYWAIVRADYLINGS
jgi:hypothetical protein